MTPRGSGVRGEMLGRLRGPLSRVGSLFRSGDARLEIPDLPSPVAKTEGERRALAEIFGEKLAKIHGSYEIVGSGQVAQRVADLVEQWKGGSSTVLSWAPAELPVSGVEQRLTEVGATLFVPDDMHKEDCRRAAAQANVGITGVEAAFAGTASMAFVPAPGRSRAAALLPVYHIALVPMSRIHPTIEAWMEGLRANGRLEDLIRDEAQLAFVTGPSKSADIELNLTLGVHGPKVVHAVIFDD